MGDDEGLKPKVSFTRVMIMGTGVAPPLSLASLPLALSLSLSLLHQRRCQIAASEFGRVSAPSTVLRSSLRAQRIQHAVIASIHHEPPPLVLCSGLAFPAECCTVFTSTRTLPSGLGNPSRVLEATARGGSCSS